MSFSGEPLYQLFIQAFEHCIENVVDSSHDRLYFQEQFTSEQSRDLVCSGDDPVTRYREARRLLLENFGDCLNSNAAIM